RGDEQFKSDLAEFSKKQSQILCEKKSICDTIDAHLALLDPSAMPLKKMSGGTTESIPGREHKHEGRAQYKLSGRHHLLRRQRQPRCPPRAGTPRIRKQPTRNNAGATRA